MVATKSAAVCRRVLYTSGPVTLYTDENVALATEFREALGPMGFCVDSLRIHSLDQGSLPKVM